MLEDNGHREEEKERQKICPFLNKYCITERCALHVKITQQRGHIAQTVSLCAINTFGVLLSEINAKTGTGGRQEKIILPGGLRPGQG